jgi:hypothetical protein
MYHNIVHSEMEAIALNVAGHGRYDLYGVPTAYCTPVFPLYLAGLFSVLGTGSLAQFVKVTLSCVASALRCGLVPLFAIDAGLGRGVAVLAGGLSVLYGAVYSGAMIQAEISGGLDAPFVALALLIVVWAILRMWRGGAWQTHTPWWFFAFCGFCALLNPSLLPAMGGFLVAGAIACPAGARRRYLRQTALAALGILAFLLPWAIRNYRSVGAPIMTRSNFGIEFWVSNGGADRTYDHPYNYETYHPTRSPFEAAKVAELGEVEYSRMRLQEGIDWVRAHPGGFLRLTAQRFAAWWFPPLPVILLPPRIVLTLLAFAGLWLMFRLQPIVAWLFLVTWITFPDVYYIVHQTIRYRYPMDWQLLLAASVALFAAYRAVTARLRARRAAREAAAVNGAAG